MTNDLAFGVDDPLTPFVFHLSCAGPAARSFVMTQES